MLKVTSILYQKKLREIFRKKMNRCKFTRNYIWCSCASSKMNLLKISTCYQEVLCNSDCSTPHQWEQQCIPTCPCCTEGCGGWECFPCHPSNGEPYPLPLYEVQQLSRHKVQQTSRLLVYRARRGGGERANKTKPEFRPTHFQGPGAEGRYGEDCHWG